MQDVLNNLPQIMAAYMVYLVAVLSPGPANLAIIGTSISQGRRAGMTIAAGVFAGSFTWAMSAALGLAALLKTYASLLEILKIVGALYLMYLGYKALRSAMRKDETSIGFGPAAPQTAWQTFLRGYGIHLTNPKAIFGWVSFISLGLPTGASLEAVAILVGGCLLTGFTTFMTYAILFSTPAALKGYKAARRWIDGIMALLFGVAAFKLMTARL